MALNIISIRSLPIEERREVLQKNFFALIGCQPEDLSDLVDFRKMGYASLEDCTKYVGYTFRVFIGSTKLDYTPFSNYTQICLAGSLDNWRIIRQLVVEHKECKQRAAEIAKLEQKIAKLRMSPYPGKDYLAAKGRFEAASGKKE